MPVCARDLRQARSPQLTGQRRYLQDMEMAAERPGQSACLPGPPGREVEGAPEQPGNGLAGSTRSRPAPLGQPHRLEPGSPGNGGGTNDPRAPESGAAPAQVALEEHRT